MSKKNNKKVVISEEQREKQELIEMKKTDTTGLKEQIYQLRQQLTYLIKQKAKIESEMVKGNQKYMKESFEIEKTIKIQEQELTDLENNYKLLKNTFEEARKKHKYEWEGELEGLSRKKNQQKENAMKNIGQMTKKIDFLKQFRVRQAQYLSTLQRLKDREQTNKQHQTKDIDKIVQEHENKRRQIRQSVTKQIDNIKQLQVNKLEQKMNREQQIKRENDIILEEIALCESEKKVLEKQYKELLKENQSNKGSSVGSLLDGQATQTYERSLRVIKLQTKLNKLKEYLQQQITRLDSELKHLQNKSGQSKKEMQQKIVKLESWLKLKDKDLKKMKACSQMVLNQRSNLQCYLLEVFHEHTELDYKDPSNVNQILRFLFIKINSKKAPISYKDYLLSTEQSQISKKSLGKSCTLFKI